MKKLFIIAIAALFAVTACSSSEKKEEKSKTSPSTEQQAESPAQTEPAAAPEEAAKPEEKQMFAHQTTDENAPIVYFIKDISPESLVKAFDALGWTPTGKTGVKISTGESENRTT